MIERLDRNRELLAAGGIAGRENDEVALWLGEGDAIVRELASAMHRELDPRFLDEPQVREWQARGRAIERLVVSAGPSLDQILDDETADLDLDFLDEDDDDSEQQRV